MEIRKDKSTGIIRHTYGTVYPGMCKKYVFESGVVTRCTKNGVPVERESVDEKDEVVFDAVFRGKNMNIISTETRTIIVGMNERIMFDLFTKIHGNEWEYDDLECY